MQILQAVRLQKLAGKIQMVSVPFWRGPIEVGLVRCWVL